MNVRIPIIVTRKRVDVFALRTAKVSIVNNACQIHTVGNIEKDANYAIVIILDRLASRAICLRVNVCVAKDLRDANVIDAQLDILVIRIVIAAIVIVMVHLSPIIPNRLRAIMMVIVHVKLW